MNELLTEIMFELFKNEELINSIKKNSKHSNLVLEVKLPPSLESQPNLNVSIYEKQDKTQYLKNHLPKYKKIREEDTKDECSICLEEYKVNTYKRTLNCNHHFHKRCIDKWLKNCSEENIHCPICRDQYSIPLQMINQFTIQKDIP